MGAETIQPIGNAPQAGQTVQRRLHPRLGERGRSVALESTACEHHSTFLSALRPNQSAPNPRPTQWRLKQIRSVARPYECHRGHAVCTVSSILRSTHELVRQVELLRVGPRGARRSPVPRCRASSLARLTKLAGDPGPGISQSPSSAWPLGAASPLGGPTLGVAQGSLVHCRDEYPSADPG